jgi:DNA-binding ferritin-like protein
MKTLSPYANTNDNPDLQMQIKSELSRAGVSNASEVGRRLQADMGREFASLAAGSAPRANVAFEILNQSLADCIDLQLQTQQAKWDARAEGATSLAHLFEEIGSRICEHEDQIAGQITSLGGTAQGTLVRVCERSGLNDYSGTSANSQSDTISCAFDVVCSPLDRDIELLTALEDHASASILSALCDTGAVYRQRLEKRPTPEA